MEINNIKKDFTLMETFHIVTYNSTLPDIKVIIQKHLHLLQSNPKLKEFFPKNSIIPSYHRSENLKEIVSPSTYQPMTTQNDNVSDGGCYKCNKNRCDLCKKLFRQIQEF